MQSYGLLIWGARCAALLASGIIATRVEVYGESYHTNKQEDDATFGEALLLTQLLMAMLVRQAAREERGKCDCR